MTLGYKLEGSSDENFVKIDFEPPLSGYDEVKPRLLSMKLDAEESLGMVPRPQLKSFILPKQVITQAVPLLGFLIYTTYGTSGIQWLRDLVGGSKTITYIWWFVFITHGLESLYTLHLCRKHRTGLVNGVYYSIRSTVNSTLISHAFAVRLLVRNFLFWCIYLDGHEKTCTTGTHRKYQ
jgi:Domain of unknown function (DUF4499)